MTEQAKIRRLQDTLTIAGNSVFGFTIWSLAKIGLFLTFVDENAVRQLLGTNDASLTNTIYIALVVIVLVDVVVRAYVGRSARAEGLGKKKSPFYLVVAALAAIANASSLVAIGLGTSFALSPLSAIVSIAIEATALAALVLVICSSIRLRRMSKAEG